MAKEVIAAYIPVLHDGYMGLIDRYPRADVGLIDVRQFEQLDYLRKDPRALTVQRAAELLSGIGRTTRILGHEAIAGLSDEYQHVIAPADDVTKALFAVANTAIKLEPVMLRWDRERLSMDVEQVVDEVIDEQYLPSRVIDVLRQQQTESTSWWLQIGAVIFDELDSGALIATHNHAVPTPYSTAIDGDPRDASYRGKDLNVYADIHAEADAIAHAARSGISLEGKAIITSHYPCPNCAKMIAASGLKACYFVEGYAVADGATILKSNGVKIIQVRTDTVFNDKNHITKPY